MFSFSRQIDKAGRLVIPKDLRRMLGLRPGDAVELHYEDGGIFLRPIPKNEHQAVR
ncbi:MAG: AbrB/MazE/SpoVT family DNA-binding domain-containing protein [Ruminococcaceae bacterium]|nr:AbrB/MazE/SpoVT family DNA-binding domain-containing protein [Oscillospiraceae bacterium]